MTETAREAKSGPRKSRPQHEASEDVARFRAAHGVQEGVFSEAAEPNLHRAGHSGRRGRPAGPVNSAWATEVGQELLPQLGTLLSFCSQFDTSCFSNDGGFGALLWVTQG